MGKYISKEKPPEIVKIDTCKVYSSMFIEKILNQDVISYADMSREEELLQRKKEIETTLEDLKNQIQPQDEYTKLTEELKAIERGLSRIYNQLENKNRFPLNVSPTEIIFGQLLSYIAKTPRDIKVVAKVFVDMTAFSPDFQGYANWEEYLQNIHMDEPELIPRWGQVIGLKYEMLAYDYIQKNIIDKRLTINLIPLIAEGYCTVDISNSYFLHKMYGSILTYTNKRKTPVGIIMTKRLGTDGKGLTTLREFVKNHKNNHTLLQKIYFQLLYTLAILEEYKIMHNDLHGDNVLVEEYKTPVTFQYTLRFGDIVKSVNFTTKYIPYIFDWDHAYVQELGDNYMNDLNIDGIYQGILNRFTPKFDLYTLLCTTEFPEIFKKYLPITDDKKRFLWEDTVFELTYNTAKTIEKNSDRIRNYNVYRMSAKNLGQFISIRPDAETVIFVLQFPENADNPVVLRILKSNNNCRRPSLPESFPRPVDLLFSDCFNFSEPSLVPFYNFFYNFSSLNRAFIFHKSYDGFKDSENGNMLRRVQTPYLKAPVETPENVNSAL